MITKVVEMGGKIRKRSKNLRRSASWRESEEERKCSP
jgi:hypothetical protein